MSGTHEELGKAFRQLQRATRRVYELRSVERIDSRRKPPARAYEALADAYEEEKQAKTGYYSLFLKRSGWSQETITEWLRRAGLREKQERQAVKQKILVVDDEPGLAEVVQCGLERGNYEIIAAYGGQEGIEKAVAGQPDLILLDIIMPDMDGLDVLRKLNIDPQTKHIPVIMLTVRSESDCMFNAKNLGAVDYVVKPIKLKELAKFIRRYA